MSDIKTITVGGITYTLPEGSPVFIGDKADWEALTAQEKAIYDESNDGLVILTDDYRVSAGIDDNSVSPSKVWSSQKVNSMLPVWTSGVQALTGATSCTITNNAISSTSVLEVFFENNSGTDPVGQVTGVSSHTATIEFDALEEDTTFYLRVTNL